MGLMDKLKAASQNAVNAVTTQAAQPAQPAGYATPPAPPAARPQLEYDEDGELEYVWDTNALDHSVWSVEEFERALADRLQQDNPGLAHESAEQQAMITAIFRAEMYKHWTQHGGWELRKNAQTRLEADPSNPVLAPVHGVTLSDYTQVNLKIVEGAPLDGVLQAMGIDQVVWSEAKEVWMDRMSSDTTHVVVTEYSRLYQAGITDPRLASVSGTIVTTNPANLERLRTDRAYLEEMAGARTAAYEAGLDGSAWILETIGVSPSDFQQAENQWYQAWGELSTRMAAGDPAARQEFMEKSPEMSRWTDHRVAKQDEYAKQFAAQNDGGAADDIAF